ncbi:ABC transporter G family member 20-like isoform X2 [Daktulosphaira vitifoliae]|uniref:ABC transporter G family member 20-like isoform X2 n=1 Tax=Daktulosphaira vitifoliae TaxID=58002 RepID=UPI0021AA2269|nr:ABC transporter G family member 20-like isoform X2 [Daktulosphaira vitifoliae]
MTFDVRKVSFYDLMGDKSVLVRNAYKRYSTTISMKDLNMTVPYGTIGGEQRRLSFGVALFHDPRIIILDEPTVGIDPVIRESIWEYLVQLSAEGKTIVITTHYIEEATKANLVGLMRNGILIGEDSPSSLIRKQNVSTLEEAFLSLCNDQEKEKKSIDFCDEKNLEPQSTTGLTKNPFSWRRFRALTYKNGAFLCKDISFLFFTFILPVVQTMFFNLCIGHHIQDLNLAIINNEINNCSTFNNYNTCFLYNSNDTKLSCKFIENMLGYNDRLMLYPNLNSGMVALKDKKVRGVLFFSSNFTESLKKRILRRANRYDVKYSTIQVYIEPNYILRQIIKNNVYEVFDKTIKTAVQVCNKSAKSVSSALVIDNVGKVNISEFIHSSAPGFIALLAFYFPMILSTGLLLTEKDEGIMSRIMAAGVTFMELVFSVMFLITIVHIIQSLIAMSIMFFVFDNPILMENFWSVAMIVMLTGYQGMFAGILAAAYSNSYTMATHINMGTNVLFTCLCGLIWPMEGAHPVLRAFNTFLPLSITSATISNLALRGWPYNHPIVLRGAIMTFMWIVIFAIPIFCFSSLKKDRWVKKA